MPEAEVAHIITSVMTQHVEVQRLGPPLHVRHAGRCGSPEHHLKRAFSRSRCQIIMSIVFNPVDLDQSSGLLDDVAARIVDLGARDLSLPHVVSFVSVALEAAALVSGSGA